MTETGGPAIGLVSSNGDAGDALLRDLVREFNSLRMNGWTGTLRPVQETADRITSQCADVDTRAIRPFPPARAGGMVRMVAGLLSEEETARVDQVVSLLEPGDALGLFPEVQALKRQCIVNRRPYLPNVHSACHWWRVEADQTAGEWTPEGKTIALVAHDSAKADMVGFAVRHHALLSRFARRIATGTTGSLLNGRLPERLTAEDRHILQPLVDGVAGLRAPDWVHCFRSGPKGGDVQIADLILDGGCDVVLFFEDPHVSREHEADIQLLERVVRLPGVRCLCFHDPATAEAWAAWAATAGHR